MVVNAITQMANVGRKVVRIWLRSRLLRMKLTLTPLNPLVDCRRASSSSVML